MITLPIVILIELWLGITLTAALVSPLSLQNTEQLVQIGDREPYEAKLTSITFPEPICIIALEIHTLQPLTGAEDVEITYNLCQDPSINATWTLAHYTNKKNVFVLKHPVLARKIAIIAGVQRSRNFGASIAILDVDIKQCNIETIFGSIREEEEKKCPSSKSPHHQMHRHRSHSPVLKVGEAELDQLLLGHISKPSLHLRHNDTIEAVFTRTKRQANTEKASTLPLLFNQTSKACPMGYFGEDCSIPDCGGVRNCSNAGTCIQPNTCKCAPNYFGADCSQCSGWFCNQCDFFCVHGQCDTITKSCLCSPGWSGAACDVCSSRNCSVNPVVAFLLPQTAEYQSKNEFVHVFGYDLPKPEDMRYHCLFGDVSTEGHWVSSSLVRCAVPSQAKPGKHVFNITPSGAKASIPTEHSKTLHFTFYVPCDPKKCFGSCFGPICLCKEGLTGPDCNLKAPTVSNKTEELKDPSVISAVEGEPYIIHLPTVSSTAVIKVFSSIPELELDPFRHIITWKGPRGNSQPYSVEAHVTDTNQQLTLHWSLFVAPGYTPLAGKVEKSGIDNGWLLKGFIEKENNRSASVKVPVLLEMLSSANPNVVIESLEIPSTSPNLFSHLFYPYSGDKESEVYTVRAKHPGKKNDTTNCSTWTLKRLMITPNAESIVLDDGFALGNYTSNAKQIECPAFDVTIIKPVETISVTLIEVSDEKVIVNFTRASVEPLPKSLNVTLAFMCDKFSGISVTQQVISVTASSSTADIEVIPKRLEFLASSKAEPQYIHITVKINSIEEELEDSLISELNLLPFFVAASNPPYLNNPMIYKNGSQIELVLGLSQSWHGSSAEGVLHFPNGKRPLLSIPYRIRPPPSEGLELIITTKGFTTNETNPIDYPLDVLIVNARGQLIVRRMIYLNVPSEFYPLPPGYYQISIKSFAFEPMIEVFHLSPGNTSFEVFLSRRRRFQFVFNGKRIISEKMAIFEPHLPPGAEIIMEPSVFYTSNLGKDLFANFIFQEGTKNATTVIDFGLQNSSHEFQVENLKNGREALRASGGFRTQIRVNRNANFGSKYEPPYCNIVKQSVPFSYSVKGISEGFESTVDYVVDKRTSELDKAVMCEKNTEPVASIPELTTIVNDCAAAKILECRAFYQPIQSCGARWKSIPDDTVSIHVYAIFMRLKADCKLADVDLKTVQALIECISSLDTDCPLAKPIAEVEAPKTPSPFNSLLSQMKAISSLTQSLHGFFPALSTLESQLIDFPNYMADFLHNFEAAFPSSDFSNIRNRAWFDAFYDVISDTSPLGPAISIVELKAFPAWKNGRNLILRWNETFEELKGEDTDLSSPRNQQSRILLLRKLTEKADKLKSLARQFAANDPFTMLHDILATIFARVDPTSNASEECAKAIGLVEPVRLRESEEFEVSVVITNVMEKQVLQNLRFQLEMLHASPMRNSSYLKYRIGPLYYSGGIPRYLSPQKTLTVSWKVQPVFEMRLTEAVKEQPNVILTFDMNGKRKVQRIRLPSITISPDRHIRVFAMGFPDVLPRLSGPFNLVLHIMNTGFSTLKNLKLVDVVPWLVDKQKGLSANYRMSAVSVNDKFASFIPKIKLGELKSGKTSVVAVNLTALGGESARFKNCSLSVLVDDQRIPENFDYKFFFISEIIKPGVYILSDKDPQNFRSNLFFFNQANTKLRNLHQIQLLKDLPARGMQANKKFFTILATFQRLMSSEEMKEAATPEGLKVMESTVYGRIQYPSDELEKGQQLVRVCEIGPEGERRNLLNLNNTWITRKGNVSQLSFIDPHALPPAIASQLTYEFTFARKEDFNVPYFSKYFYQETIPENIIPKKYTVIGKVAAQSPVNSKLSYSLVSADNEDSFVINTKTGELILVKDTLPLGNQICYNILVTDSEGRISVVPLEIKLSAKNQSSEQFSNKCQIFEANTPVIYHEFKGDRSVLQMMEYGDLTPTESPSTLDGGEMVTISTEEEEVTTESGTTYVADMVSTLPGSPEAMAVTLLPTTTLVDEIPINSIPTSQTIASTTMISEENGESLGTWDQTKITEDDVSTTAATVEMDTVSFTTQAVRIRTTPKIIHETNPDDYFIPGGTTPSFTVGISSSEMVADWYTEPNSGGYSQGNAGENIEITTMLPQTTELPRTATTPMATESHRPFPTPPPLIPSMNSITPGPEEIPAKPSTLSDNILISYMSTVLPFTVSPLPVATRISLYHTIAPTSAAILGQVSSQAAGFMQPNLGPAVEDTSASMVDTACRLRNTKPIWAVVCDMAKTVSVKSDWHD